MKGRQGIWFVLLAAVLGAGGCSFPQGVAWLPDSSGFVYTDKEGGRVVHFDLAKKSQRVIAKLEGVSTPWPGLRADGKRVAVAKVQTQFTAGSDIAETTLQLILLDLQGKEVKRSRSFAEARRLEEPSAETKTTTDAVGLDWSGPEEKIVVAGTSFGLLIYDVPSNKWTRAKKLIPFPYGGSSCCPSGRGFLALEDQGGKGKLYFYEFDDGAHGFDVDLDFDNEKNPPLAFEWRDDVFLVIRKNEVLELDTLTMKSKRRSAKLPLLESEGQVRYVHRFAGKKTQICLMAWKAPDAQGQEQDRWRLELQSLESKTCNPLFTDRDYQHPIPGFAFFPSPDGKLAALNLQKQSDGQRWIVVLDSNGKTVSKVQTE